MDESVIFTTRQSALVTSLYSGEQAVLRQCASRTNSAVKVGKKYLFIAQSNKALINVYNIEGSHKRETVEQRLPLPEAVNCLEVIQNQYNECREFVEKSAFDLPYLLLASTESGKLYCWELNSGALLNVKQMAHYQAITRIKSIMDGKYFVTSGKDSRVIIWQTSDFVSNSSAEPKPVCILHDHTLSVTDIAVSMAHGENFSTSGVKLFTGSEDSTIRCYDVAFLKGDARKKLNNENKSLYQPKLLATFTFPAPITSLALDPADRSLYAGTAQGVYNLSLYYHIENTHSIVNLVQASSSNKNKIYSIVENNVAGNLETKKLFSMGQLVSTKLLQTAVTKLEITFDGTILLVGNQFGRISVLEVASKQILRTLQPLTTADTEEDPITNIITNIVNRSAQDNILEQTSVQNKNTQKLPVLQRIMFDKSQKHELWFQNPETPELSRPINAVLPLADFDSYMDQLRSQEAVFATTETTTQVKVVNTSSDEGQGHGQEQELQDIKKAYKELRELHESLFKEHEQLLSSMN
ncbi:Pre-rRNA-processing protein IPI3 [Nakaseomyces bracarensis]|uniref:Pre-rRNA-processing protein IPI3 n=1 Tax=Nakaseomyces bracarensis TaxID=273131 RepID=A0ABR4NUL4_9SACH